MISRLPKWIEYGAFILAFVAGYINVVGLLGFEHQAVSHLSGTATLVGASVSSEPVQHTLYLAGVLLAFVVGAAVSGFLVHDSNLKLGRHYDTSLVLEAALLFASLYLLSRGSQYGHYLASAACGLQNALATTYSGAIVRTTHLTGIFTDLGIMIGSAFRGDAFDRRKAILFMLIIAGFITGGTAGAYAFGAFHFNALMAPACICLVLAGIYHLYSRRYQ